MVTAVVVLLALAGGACGSASGDSAAARAQLSGPIAAASTVVPGTPSTTAPPASSTTVPSRATGSASPAATAAAPTTPPTTGSGVGATPALTPAPPGTYQYDTVGQSMLGTGTASYPAVTTLVVDPPTGTTQHAVRNLQDALGNGPMLDTTFDYRADGLYLVDLKATAKVLLFSDTEDIAPPTPVLLLPTGFRVGYHAALDLPAATGTAHVVIDALRHESVTVAGRSVDTVVIHMVATLPGAYNASLDLTVWLAPSARLWAREHLIADAAAGGVTYHSEYDATIRSF